ncbi:DUF1871 family protein [Niallia sp. 01092]|uniref:DUF1871 family protein n=1 Tax=unclassified Niallia TaxID=2837522 RepID=UPI003FD2BE7F
MNFQEMNIEMVNVLNKWDPFQIGEGNYETEIADCIQAVHDLDNINALAEKIQSIYEFSFEEYISMDQCVNISKQLLAIKDNGACSL